ncbi:GNAT family N-acetyltransferase [Duganella violaceipulchra]|uniref:GNAT family N-acetyltransferase n=1 Tax=Duganella violaceipulchra TaxID=2849652 RepID=A0AA41L148_9BURK|nr:GNAT family N-acetyltransferase [Duganella violaceicalia]MBV6324191.1 GNAT family N-acetyltransferase [Duganella violaceicalia]MCP2011876.1 N-acetylglutamate synthase-like GNAT family acetyltransferase [Duganella violaceicalia]
MEGDFLIEIFEASPSELGDVANLYAEAAYGAAIDPADTLILARSGGKLVGAVRLCAEEGVTVLRGMQIRSTFQRKGIGAQLLAACQPYLGRRQSFCLPYAHLVTFYAAAGFELAAEAGLPDFLVRRLNAYNAQAKNVVAMRRDTRGG